MTAANRRPSKVTRSLVAVTGAAALSALAGAALLWRARVADDPADDPNDLMARATLAVPAPVWKSGSGGGAFGPMGGANHGWINAHEIVRLEQTATRFYAPTVLDTTRPNARERRIIAVAAPGLPLYGVQPRALSPDGKWLLCVGWGFKSPQHYFAAALDGSRRRRDFSGSSYTDGQVMWFADSRRFMTVIFDPSKNVSVARVFSVDTGDVSPVFSLPGTGRGGGLIRGALPFGRFLKDSHARDFRKRFVFPTRETMTVLTVTRGEARPATITIAAPPVGPCRNRRGYPVIMGDRLLRVSPHEGRLLWVVTTFDYPASAPGGSNAFKKLFYPLLGRFLPNAFHTSSGAIRHHYKLWTSRLDSPTVTPLGVITVRDRGASYHLIDDWAWTPDGKRISFTYGDALYTLPAGESAP